MAVPLPRFDSTRVFGCSVLDHADRYRRMFSGLGQQRTGGRAMRSHAHLPAHVMVLEDRYGLWGTRWLVWAGCHRARRALLIGPCHPHCEKQVEKNGPRSNTHGPARPRDYDAREPMIRLLELPHGAGAFCENGRRYSCGWDLLRPWFDLRAGASECGGPNGRRATQGARATSRPGKAARPKLQVVRRIGGLLNLGFGFEGAARPPRRATSLDKVWGDNTL